MSDERPSVRIAVVIATCDRFGMLSERSIPSVIGQERSPDYLVVIDDSRSEARLVNEQLVSSIELPGCRVVYQANQRTEGASGAWNTAVFFLASEADAPEELFVAVLDDDDAWHPSYLERCASAVRARTLDIVAADLRRFESIHGVPVAEPGPEELRAADFLTGNPGVQGSNLFVRLSVLLAAGGFDEALRSSTDRDLCIRIADLGWVRYGRLPLALVDHFADAGHARLSTRGSETKLDGLTAFWRKYVGRMNTEQRSAFSARASALFGWSPPPDPAGFGQDPSECRPKKALVLGLISDHQQPDRFLDVVASLARARDESLVGLDVVLLEAGRSGGSRTLLDVAAATLWDSGAGCFRVSLERQAEDGARGLFESGPPQDGERPETEQDRRRRMLRVYGAHVAGTRTGTELRLAGRSPWSPPALAQAPAATVLDVVGAEQVVLVADSPPLDVEVVARLDRWVLQERAITAEHRVRRCFSPGPLRLLGHGSEAVVFTDGCTVFKCIDYWKTRLPRHQLDFLRNQGSRWGGVPGLYAIRDIIEDGPWVVLTYDYEVSTPFQGGHQADLVRFLNGCARVGIVCNNVHPKNLVVTASGVRLIDYGSDILPWSPLGFEHMARRAYLACEHATHPDLPHLMRVALDDLHLPEMAGYASFRAQLDGDPGRAARVGTSALGTAPTSDTFLLHVGIISSDARMIRPLLRGLASVRTPSVRQTSALILDNGCTPGELDDVVADVRRAGIGVAVVDVDRQRRDASAGAFGAAYRARPEGQVGIAQARTMLQRYLGTLMTQDVDSIGWILDDDMRVDDRARAYLPWLPSFREAGVDVLLGAYEGASPNPPLNGLRVHLVDLLHNLHWMRGMSPAAVLPDRSAENAALRDRFPDYYYDLSRKHTGHLEMPQWLEPAVPGETVAQARARLLAGALGLLSGAPLTRPIVAAIPSNPLAAAMDSVNRGGSTFILNPSALTRTPNTITPVQGREARRSDMVWAIVNRYYRRMTIKAVGFPVHHVGRVDAGPSLNVEKVRGEIVGSTLYAGMTEFLRCHPSHELDFSPQETLEICRLADAHLARRWAALESSFRRIAGISGAIRQVAGPGQLEELCGYLDRWFTPESFRCLRSGVGPHASRDVEAFLASLRAVADDFASATVEVGFIRAQLEVPS